MKILIKCLALALFFSLSPLADVQGLNFTIQDLGLANVKATAMNNDNVVVGRTKDQSKEIEFIWERDKGLTCLTHTPATQSPFINNRGTVAGILWEKTAYWIARNTQSKHIYLRDLDGSYRDIGAPPKWDNQSLGATVSTFLHDNRKLGLVRFNDREQLLIANAVDPAKATEFAIWQKGTFQHLDPHALNKAYDMNNEGLILGRKWIKEGHLNVPMLVLYNFEQDTTTEIMIDANLLQQALKLNDQGQVIIIQRSPKEEKICGFLWDQNNGLLPLDNFIPFAINNNNQMIGLRNVEDKESLFFWDNGELSKLDEALKASDPHSLWNIITINDLNDGGHILGRGVFDGEQRAVILSPQPETPE